ncbi:MAG: sulfotransferase [Pseudomonadota bacterium]
MNGEPSKPIFVLGSARSGTTLMASLVTASSEVAVYRAESMLLNGCERCYGALSSNRAKVAFADDWVRSRQFRRLGITEDAGRALVRSSASYANLLRDVMSQLADRQEKGFWLDSTPGHVFSLQTIARAFPDAKIIHMVRDGRAVSASLRKLGWVGMRASDPEAAIQYSALKWERSIEAFERCAPSVSGQAMTVRYEDVVRTPDRVMEAVTAFIGLKPFDFQTALERRDRHEPTGDAVVSSNTAFEALGDGLSEVPIHRWRKTLSEKEIRLVETTVGETLASLGYAPISEGRLSALDSVRARSRSVMFNAKDIVRSVLPLRRLHSTPLEIARH